MGYTIKVGNALPVFDKDDFPYLRAEWEVEEACHPDAPTFPNDEMTGNGNSRSPSYGVWSEFCREAGIYEMFFDRSSGFIAQHPGCAGLCADHVEAFRAARDKMRAAATLPPGFEGWEYKGTPRFDYNLARIEWLTWWAEWALENCETPAIHNT